LARGVLRNVRPGEHRMGNHPQRHAATGTLNILGARAPIVDRVQVDPAVIQAGRAWERERLAQGGYVDPIRQSGQDWEQQRGQQGGASR
jgi:hypothetical protein